MDRSPLFEENTILTASRYDYLTGLPSMTWFFELAKAGGEALIKEGIQPALLFLDLCGMKYFNSHYGFAEGNRLLKAFADLLARYFGREHSCRISQDHFTAYTKAEGLDEVLRRFLEDCRDLNEGRSLFAHIGIYPKQSEALDVSTACDRAKLACDALKNNQESAFNYFSQSLQTELERRRYIIENLDRALDENWVKVYYQPIVRSVNRGVCNEEALARWVDPEKGLLPPIEFIPILEDSRLIYRLDLYMLEQVLERLKKQSLSGMQSVPQSINLSRSDFDSCDMVEEIRQRVDASGIGRDKITIELTESVVGSDPDFIQEQIRRFRELGFAVWMDDFGSGYSSLDVLQNMTFDLIKFDMHFMRQFDKGNNGKIILTELMRMATALGVDTLCEGVETEEQVRFLREIGCSKLQGFYYGPPIPIEKIIEKYEKGLQIGFENPKESSYFEAISRVNLYDLGVISQEDSYSFQSYFNTLPIALMEIRADKVRYLRSNQSYRDFLERYFGVCLTDTEVSFSSKYNPEGSPFMHLLKQCCTGSNQSGFIDDTLPDGSVAQSFVRRIACNPVRDTIAVATAVLSITEPNEGTTYANIARALAADYFNLFYVDLETGHFIEYSSDVGGEKLVVEQHGENFFQTSERIAKTRMYEEDLPDFYRVFNKEYILKALDEQGTFTFSYRILQNGVPTYVNMKAMRDAFDRKHIVFGISNINYQMQKYAANKSEQNETAAFQNFVDGVGMACAVLSVAKKEDGSCGEIRIVRSNRLYKEIMGPAYYDDMPYQELVPQDNKFEEYCFQAAFNKKRMHAYVETRALNFWVDQTMIPLESDRDDLGYCQFIFEFTESAEAERMASVVSMDTAETVIKGCIKLMGTEDFHAGVEEALDVLKEMSHAESVRIMLIDHANKKAIKFAERLEESAWTRRNPFRDAIDYDLMKTWEAMIGVSNAVIVKDNHDLDLLEPENPEWIASMRRHGVHSLVLIPLRRVKEVIGYLYVVNFDTEKIVEVKEVVELLAFFLGSEISNHLLMNQLDEISHLDMLTGLNNRRAMSKRMKEIEDSRGTLTFGVVNLDLNGLKYVNDNEGHEAGDRLLIQASEVLQKVYYQDDLFRTGGDEFVVMLCGISRDTFERKLARLHRDLEKNADVSFAVGGFWSDGSVDLTTAFRHADEKMYADKKAFYEKHPELKRS